MYEFSNSVETLLALPKPPAIKRMIVDRVNEAAALYWMETTESLYPPFRQDHGEIIPLHPMHNALFINIENH